MLTSLGVVVPLALALSLLSVAQLRLQHIARRRAAARSCTDRQPQ